LFTLVLFYSIGLITGTLSDLGLLNEIRG